MRTVCVVGGVLVVLAVSACNRPAPIVANRPDAGAVETPAPSPQPPAAPSAIASPGTVIVARGDTLYGIARRNDVAIRSLIEANDLAPPYTLYVGQTLMVPSLPEYLVRGGDTLSRIALCQGVDMSELARLNVIDPPYDLAVGQRLRLPPVTRQPACPGAAPDSDRAASVQVVRLDEQMAAIAPPAAEPLPDGSDGPIAQPPPRAAETFLWPVPGQVISAYGPKPGNRFNDGINIEAPAGAPVRAADNGVVVYVGNELRGYGNLILVRHAGNWTSAYAHNSEITVGRGAVVERGDIIARVGATGNVSSPQSHFELRRGAATVDPLKHLARR